MWPFKRHKHTWNILRVEWYEQSIPVLGGGQPVTMIYGKCTTCHKRLSWLKDGHWTKEELTN